MSCSGDINFLLVNSKYFLDTMHRERERNFPWLTLVIFSNLCLVLRPLTVRSWGSAYIYSSTMNKVKVLDSLIHFLQLFGVYGWNCTIIAIFIFSPVNNAMFQCAFMCIFLLLCDSRCLCIVLFYVWCPNLNRYTDCNFDF